MARAAAHRAGTGTLVAVLAALASPGAANSQGESLEYAVKAAYLSKFGSFIGWPAGALGPPSSPFQLCILGEDPFGASLDRAVTGQTVDNHPVAVRRLQRVDADAGCHILYLGASRGQTPAEAIRAVRGSPTLTVADDGEPGGAIIRFVIKDNRVRFAIDTTAAAANRVTISSKLLGLATSVRSGS